MFYARLPSFVTSCLPPFLPTTELLAALNSRLLVFILALLCAVHQFQKNFNTTAFQKSLRHLISCNIVISATVHPSWIHNSRVTPKRPLTYNSRIAPHRRTSPPTTPSPSKNINAVFVRNQQRSFVQTALPLPPAMVKLGHLIPGIATRTGNGTTPKAKLSTLGRYSIASATWCKPHGISFAARHRMYDTSKSKNIAVVE